MPVCINQFSGGRCVTWSIVLPSLVSLLSLTYDTDGRDGTEPYELCIFYQFAPSPRAKSPTPRWVWWDFCIEGVWRDSCRLGWVHARGRLAVRIADASTSYQECGSHCIIPGITSILKLYSCALSSISLWRVAFVLFLFCSLQTGISKGPQGFCHLWRAVRKDSWKVKWNKINSYILEERKFQFHVKRLH